MVADKTTLTEDSTKRKITEVTSEAIPAKKLKKDDGSSKITQAQHEANRKKPKPIVKLSQKTSDKKKSKEK